MQVCYNIMVPVKGLNLKETEVIRTMSDTFLAPEEITPKIEYWLLQHLEKASAQGFVLGLSGGIDSAVVSVLLKRICPENMLAVIMPCHSLEHDTQDAYLLAQQFDIPVISIDLSTVYDEFLSSLRSGSVNTSELAKANMKPRLRMTTLYSIAQSLNYLVCGTSNLAELALGYFTKHGDSGVDILPLGDLLKREVNELARYLGVPGRIIEKPPSAGLWPGQTDEEEMGLKYEDIDNYLSGSYVGASSIPDVIGDRIRRAEHKRKMAPICPLRTNKTFFKR